MSTVVGIDGCKSGWFYFRRESSSITHGIAKSIDDLVSSFPENSRVFIDIPIGLLDDKPEGRECDRETRQLLGSTRSASVFSAPCRPVLETRSFDEAKEVSFKAIGKKLSIQAFAITSKIKEVDRFLLSNRKPIVIREVHPELCFWALNNRVALSNSKKKSAGFIERLNILCKYIPNTEKLVADVLQSYLRKEVAKDDVLDALVALIVASTSEDALSILPAIPVKDSKGLAMEIVYTEQPNERAL